MFDLLSRFFIGLLLVNFFIKNTNGCEAGDSSCDPNSNNDDGIRRMIDLSSNNGVPGTADGDKKIRRLTSSFTLYEFGIYSSDLGADISSDGWELVNIDDLNGDLFDSFIDI